MSKILLLNPPGKRRYHRDYYCSHTSKARYFWYPIDLLMQSGYMAQLGVVKVLDCIAGGIDTDSALREIEKFSPDIIFFLSGMVSYREDIEFLKRAAALCKAKFIGSGDIFFEADGDILEKFTPFLDGYLLNFISDSASRWIAGERGELPNFAYREEGKWVKGPRTPGQDGFHLPLPRHELFPMKKYRYPFMRYSPLGTILSAYGCAFHCRFCQGSDITFRRRDMGNVMEELRGLHRMGVRELHVRDLTFAADKKHALEFMDAILREGFKFRWHCLSRVDTIDDELAKRMAGSGCKSVHFGIETLNKQTLKYYLKNFDPSQAEEALEICKRHGIHTIVSFIFGLPLDGREDMEKIIQFAVSHPITAAAFNIAVPRPMTDFKREMIKDGKINLSGDFDCSGEHPVITIDSIAPEEILAYRNRAIRKMYLRPSYWLNLIRGLESVSEFRFMAEDFLALMGGQLKSMKDKV